MKRKLCSLLLALCMVLTMIPTAFADGEIKDEEASESLTWELSEDGVLFISGTGNMWGGDTVPWSSSAKSITAVHIGSGVTSIGNGAFYTCNNLKEITIPDSVTRIGDYAFDGCTSLTSVSIPDSVTKIGFSAFSHCTSLTSVTIPDSVTDFSGAFQSCTALASVTIGDGVTTIGNAAFNACTSLTEITIPDSVTTIGNSAFARCTSLTSVSIPNSVTTIGFCAFNGCTSLTEITIPNSVTEIVYWAFSGCTSLTEIIFTGECPDIGDSFGNSTATAYYPCGSDTWTEAAVQTLAEENPTITWKSGHIQQTIPAKAATCTEPGLTEGKTACGCGEVAAVKQTTIPAGHTQQTVPGKKPTCTEPGLTDGKACSCGEVVTVEQTAIPATGHKETTISGKNPTCGEPGLTAGKKCYVCGTATVEQTAIPATDRHVHNGDVQYKAPTCTEPGFRAAFVCVLCGENVEAQTYPAGHRAKTEDIIHKDPTCTEPGRTTFVCEGCGETVEIETSSALGHKYENNVCTVCGDKKISVEGVDRVYGSSRYDTAFQSADTLKKQMGVEKFSCAIVTSGDNFADALAGSYLAYVKNAPILLTDNDNIGDVMAYIQKNVEKGATVYALGGKAVVTDKLLDLEKKGYDVKRLAGKSRFETNLEILKECGSVAGKDILVCTGFNFADSLSASAAKRPILLVDDKLTSEQKAYLKQQSGCKYCIVGGTGAVTSSVEKSLKSYGTVSRLAGSNRFETSVMVAKKFFSDPTTAVLAYGYNFPDGLCAGPLAATINAPLILTATGDEAQAAAYAKEEGIKDGMVLGGSALINDKAVKKIFSMGSGDKIK